MLMPVHVDSCSLIKRDSEVWVEDKSIAVIAQTTTFRFHKTDLSIHSSLFRKFRDLCLVPLARPFSQARMPTRLLTAVVPVHPASPVLAPNWMPVFRSLSHVH